jgi:hypothetical protein
MIGCRTRKFQLLKTGAFPENEFFVMLALTISMAACPVS